MDKTIKTIFGMLVIAVLALWTASCEDNGVIAPGDGQIILSASPGTVVLDPENGVSSGTTTVTAQLFDGAGFPLENVSVIFTTTSGTLASAGASGQPPSPRNTDQNGFANDVLTVDINSPGTVTVTARSATLSGDKDVSVSQVGVNELPTAVANVTTGGGSCVATGGDPACEAQIGDNVSFTSTGSGDPDGNITCYQWEIDSNINANDRVAQGPSTSSLSLPFDAEQSVTVTLRVTDDPDATTFCNPSCQGPPSSCGEPASSFNATSLPVFVNVVCENDPPEADAGGNKTNTLPSIGGSIDIQLDGVLSDDPDGTIVDYLWDCGNGTSAQPVVGFPARAICTYNAANTYAASMTVRDDGDGSVGMDCQRSDTDNFNVTINNPTTP